MPQRTYVCRHCRKEFVPLPGKPGLVDECPQCWDEEASRIQNRIPKPTFKDTLKPVRSAETMCQFGIPEPIVREILNSPEGLSRKKQTTWKVYSWP